ncbi:efflux RND transporter periplasmic adaptor subunit [Croceicoccus bisphenolivorans]|uniref:efflux RND transporter periplasmic adaptor subunit n=1 Tax=Croceicoccus bisphenolivorans TaxID=1783232 RepID=UPI00083710A6|nr:efflux RND transporter periplasmic adaptor subunit [Croceicoccus bisphenolivorans]
MNYDTPLDQRHADDASAGYVVDETVLTDVDDSAHQRRHRKQIVIGAIIAAIVVLIIAIALYMNSAGGGDAASEGGEQIPVVSVIVPGKGTVISDITASGTLAARRPLPVGSVGEGGQVVDVRVDEGDWVRKGQLLAVIDRSVQSQQAAAQAAQVQVARADASLAQSNLDRALALVERGFISKADVDRLTATRDAAVARVRVAESQLGELRARTARLNIVAPAGGLVLERNVELGQVVSAGAGTLFLLAQGGEMELAALVGEGDLSRLAVGASAEVSPVGSDQTFTGQIWQLSPTIDESSRQGEARIALSYDRALRPGGFATARIGTGGVSAPLLPESAILNDEAGTFVYIVDKDNKVRRRAVRTGLVTDAGITIAEGLTGSERIVMMAGGFLFEGDEVKPSIAKSGE